MNNRRSPNYNDCLIFDSFVRSLVLLASLLSSIVWVCCLCSLRQ
jgi:hypothetical protein